MVKAQTVGPAPTQHALGKIKPFRLSIQKRGYAKRPRETVMAGLVPAIHVLPPRSAAWMPGTRPGMTR